MELDQLASVRRTAVGVDLVAVAVTLYANVVAAPATVTGVLLAAAAPAFLGLAIVIWHQGHAVLTGWAGRLFTAGLFGIASMCAVVSYSHIREVAAANGQSALAAGLLPIIVDGTAVLSSLVVLSCNRTMHEIRAVAAAEAEAERVARAEDEAARREAKRLADEDAARAIATARAEAETAERKAAAERETAAERRRAALAALKAAKANGSSVVEGGTDARVAAVLTARAGERNGRGPTASQIADEIGVTKRTVQRCQAWIDRADIVAGAVASPESESVAPESAASGEAAAAAVAEPEPAPDPATESVTEPLEAA